MTGANDIYPEVANAIEVLLRPPQAVPVGHSSYPAANSIADYLGEPNSHRWTSRLLYGVPWMILEAISTPFIPRGYERNSERGANTPEPSLPDLGGLSALFDRNYRHAHKLAVAYAILYRGSFLWNYVLGALAVTCALLSYADGARSYYWSVGELVVLAVLIYGFWLARSRRWQERSVEYRFLAEHFRQMRFLHLLGLTTPDFRHPVYYISGEPQRNWMNWYFSAVVRMVGLPDLVMTTDYLERVDKLVRTRWAGRQLEYHRDNEQFLKGVVRLLTLLITLSFSLAFLACILHIVAYAVPSLQLHEYAPWFTLVAAAAPAWGAACHAIEVQGEFEWLALRSCEVQIGLKALLRRMEQASDSAAVAELFRNTSDLSEVMLADVIDWRIIYQLRSTTLP